MARTKYHLVSQLLLPCARSVLDVGCRDGILKGFLPPRATYVGLDMQPGTNVGIVANVDNGIPCADESYDATAALDLLEHVDNPWFVFRELVRVTRYQLFLSLPNIYHWRFRLRFLLGLPLGGKYGFPVEPPADRHRWLTSYNNSVFFCRHMARKFDLDLAEYRLFCGRVGQVLDALVSSVSGNVGVYTTLFVFARKLRP